MYIMVIYAYQGAGMPPRQEFWCQYAQAWAAVKHVWELQSTAAERQALRDMLATC
jgi:hypothetical protein